MAPGSGRHQGAGGDDSADTAKVADGVALLEMPDVLAKALAEAEALATQKATRAAVAKLTRDLDDSDAPAEVAEGETPAAAPPVRSIGPAIRGMPMEDRATVALKGQFEALKISAEGEQVERARAEKALEQLKADLKATRGRFQRANDQLAELQKRLDRAEIELPARTTRYTIKAMLPVLDAQHEVFAALLRESDLSEASRAAIAMVINDWERCLLGLGLTAFDAQGQRFDPAVHDAISSLPPPEGVAPGTVLRQVGRGYLLDGRLLRSAQVVVAGEG